MKIIKRTMESSTEYDKNGALNCQASFNSDGCVTIRNYNQYQKNDDEIIILTRNETAAVIKLMKELSNSFKVDIPF